MSIRSTFRDLGMLVRLTGRASWWVVRNWRSIPRSYHYTVQMREIARSIAACDACDGEALCYRHDAARQRLIEAAMNNKDPYGMDVLKDTESAEQRPDDTDSDTDDNASRGFQ